MALITCPECGKEISDKANVCPYCACPSEYFNDIGKNINKKKFYEKAWFSVIFLLTIWPIGVYLMYKFNHFNKFTRISIVVLEIIIVIINLLIIYSTIS